TIEGLPPNLAQAQRGCRFAVRCPHAIDICLEPTLLRPTDVDTVSSCRRADDIALGKIGWAGAGAGQADGAAARTMPLLSIRDLRKHFRIRSGFGKPAGIVRAVEDFSIDIQ